MYCVCMCAGMCVCVCVCTIAYRILVPHRDEFKEKASEVVWHIPSKFTEKMSMKSEIVSKH